MQMQGSEKFGEVREACGIDARRSTRLFANHLAPRRKVVRRFVAERRASLATQQLFKPRATSSQFPAALLPQSLFQLLYELKLAFGCALAILID